MARSPRVLRSESGQIIRQHPIQPELRRLVLLLSLSKNGREFRGDPTESLNFRFEVDRDFRFFDNLSPLRDGKTGNDANKRLPVFL